MNRDTMHWLVAAGALGLSAAAGSTLRADVLTPTLVTSSGQYGGLPDFPASNVIDGQGVTYDANGLAISAQDQFGDSATSGSASYWLTPENGGAGSYFVLDLSSSADIAQFRLANTRNTGYGDRTTMTFSILGSNSLNVSNNLASPTTLLDTQSLAMPSDPNAIPVVAFNPVAAASFGSYRYIEFLIDTANAGNNNGGLNEIQVISTPEPAALGLLGLGTLSLLRRRSR